MARTRKTAVARKAAKPARPASGAKKAAARPAKAAAAKPARKPSAPVKAAKPTALAKGSKPVAKTAPSAKPVAAKSASPAKSVAAKLAPAAKGTPVKSGARPPLKAVPANKGGKAAVQPAMKKGAAPPPPPSSKKAAAKGRMVLVTRAPKPDPQVRPLGVLPPESRARVPERVAAPATIVHRTNMLRPKPAAARSQGADRVSEQDLKEFETRLLAERERLLREMGHLESTIKINQRDSSGDLSGYSFHMADAGTDAIEREKAFMFASAEGRMLLEIKDALGRLYRGEYGVCESCQKPIARARLQAMPYARLCVSCKEKEEKASRGAM
jgi:DnaK suppressor protein